MEAEQEKLLQVQILRSHLMAENWRMFQPVKYGCSH
jgi:hypothetical protein